MKVDVAIAGGGPAASACAIALHARGVSCAIVARDDRGGDKPGESLAPAIRPLLDALGIDLARDGHLPCHGNRSVWGSDAPVEMPFLLSPYGHGWHLDRRRFEDRLTAMADVPRVASLDDVRAPFVVDATGRSAAIARQRGARVVREDALTATVAFFATHACDSFTFLEAIEDGWWYSAPLPDGRAVAMFVSDRNRDFDAMLARAPHTRARVGRREGALLRRDCGSARLDRVTGDGWIAIGDAACALDPLSSHGIGAALFGGVAAADAIASGDFAAYEGKIEFFWTQYVAMRREMYAAETRFPRAPFWSGRSRYTARS